MAGIKNNRRTIYTKKVIKEEFLNLLEKKELSKITVTEICKVANLNRGTFYLHYADPYELFETIEAELINQMLPLVMESSTSIYEWMQTLLTVIKENDKATKIVLTEYKDGNFLNSILFKVHDLAITEFSETFQEKDPKVLEYYFTYFVSGTIGVIIEWLVKGENISADKMTSIIMMLLSKSPLEYK